MQFVVNTNSCYMPFLLSAIAGVSSLLQLNVFNYPKARFFTALVQCFEYLFKF